MSNEQLALKAQSGDQAAAMALWDRVKGFVIWRVGDDPDVLQESFLCFCDSIKRFDLSKGAFTTFFLSYRLKGAPRAAKTGTRKRDPLSDALSLDEAIPGAEDLDLGDTIPDETAEDAFLQPEHKELCEAVNIALSGLLPDEQRVIRLRYWGELSLEKTAQKMNLTTAAVRKIEASAMKKLRHPSVSRQLRQYL